MKNETIIELAGLKCKMCSYPKKIMVETREATRQKELIKILSKKKRFDEKRQILDKHIFDCIKFGLG